MSAHTRRGPSQQARVLVGVGVGALALVMLACTSFQGSDSVVAPNDAGTGGDDGGGTTSGDATGPASESSVPDEGSVPYVTPCNGQRAEPSGLAPSHVCDDFDKSSLATGFWTVSGDGTVVISTTPIEGGLAANRALAAVIQGQNTGAQVTKSMASMATYVIGFDYQLTSLGNQRCKVFTAVDSDGPVAALEITSTGMTASLLAATATGTWQPLTPNAGWRHASITLNFGGISSVVATFNGVTTNVATGAVANLPTAPVLGVGVVAGTVPADCAIEIDNVDFLAK